MPAFLAPVLSFLKPIFDALIKEILGNLIYKKKTKITEETSHEKMDRTEVNITHVDVLADRYSDLLH